MDAPDELRQAIAMALSDADGTRDGSGHLPQCELVEAELWPIYEAYADAVLSVPAVAEVFARDAKVRGIVKEWDTTPTHDTHHMGSFKAMDSIWALFASGGGES